MIYIFLRICLCFIIFLIISQFGWKACALTVLAILLDFTSDQFKK